MSDPVNPYESPAVVSAPDAGVLEVQERREEALAHSMCRIAFALHFVPVIYLLFMVGVAINDMSRMEVVGVAVAMAVYSLLAWLIWRRNWIVIQIETAVIGLIMTFGVAVNGLAAVWAAIQFNHERPTTTLANVVALGAGSAISGLIAFVCYTYFRIAGRMRARANRVAGLTTARTAAQTSSRTRK